MSPLPSWLVKPIPKRSNILQLRRILKDLPTVCESAKCPNVGECYAHKTVTFMILGEVCTRKCAFCGVKKGAPQAIDPDEPQKIAEAVKKLGIKYTVITSVTRDDLLDGGAGHFAKVIQAIEGQVEVLIPDFQGDAAALKIVIAAKPLVINHNLETVPRLYPAIRPQASYHRSLNLLENVKKIEARIYTKSGIMVGLGEREDEVLGVLSDLRKIGCDAVTIGQYLPPSKSHLPVVEYIHPSLFEKYGKAAKEMGFLYAASAPFVRSSYHAAEIGEVI